MVDSAQILISRATIKIFKTLPVFPKERRFGIAVRDGLPMQTVPVWVADHGFVDHLKVLTFDFNGYGQPDCPIGRLDSISVPPVSPRILHVIKQNKFVDQIYQVKVSLPRNVVGLDQR